jgi:phosphohistidine phosphatase
MRRLLLLRHAKTERAQPGERDRDRALTARGRADAAVIGAYMARHRLVPERALISPVRRAKETWTIVAAAFAKAPPVVEDERIYAAGPDALLGLLRGSGDARSLLVIGHNPALHELALRLIAAGDEQARERVREKLPTSGLVVIDFPVDDWSRPHGGEAGRLERFVSPRLIAEATD